MSEHHTQPDDAQAKLLPSSVSPGAVAEAMEDPEIFQQVARGDLYVQMAKMRQLAANPSMSVTQRMDYLRFLARMGQVEKPEGTDNPFGNVPAIQIVLPGVGQSTQIGSSAKVVNEHE